MVLFDTGSMQGLLATVVVSFVIGLAFGAITKHAIKLGIVLVFAIIIMIVTGYVAPSQLTLLINLLAPEVIAVQGDLGLFLPLTASFFAIGFGIGLWKG